MMMMMMLLSKLQKAMWSWSMLQSAARQTLNACHSYETMLFLAHHIKSKVITILALADSSPDMTRAFCLNPARLAET